jgi:hypothetical protein
MSLTCSPCSQVAKRTKSTPKQLNLRAVRRKAPNGRIETRYAFAGARYPKLIVFVKQSSETVTQRHVGKHMFAGQADMLLEDMRRKDAKDSGVGGWARLQSIEALETKGFGAMLPRGASSSGSAATTPSRGHPATDLEMPAPASPRGSTSLDGMDVCQAAFDPDREGETTCSTVGLGSASDASFKKGSSVDPVGARSDAVPALYLDDRFWPTRKLPSKIEHLQTVTAPGGTILHWLQRSPLEEVQLGDANQREKKPIGAAQKEGQR